MEYKDTFLKDIIENLKFKNLIQIIESFKQFLENLFQNIND